MRSRGLRDLVERAAHGAGRSATMGFRTKAASRPDVDRDASVYPPQVAAAGFGRTSVFDRLAVRRRNGAPIVRRNG